MFFHFVITCVTLSGVEGLFSTSLKLTKRFIYNVKVRVIFGYFPADCSDIITEKKLRISAISADNL